jgi:hypothetical protein
MIIYSTSFLLRFSLAKSIPGREDKVDAVRVGGQALVHGVRHDVPRRLRAQRFALKNVVNMGNNFTPGIQFRP